MATHVITSPDGVEYEITAPDGATDQEILDYAQSNIGKLQPTKEKPIPRFSEGEKQSKDFSFGEMVSNIPSSAYQLGKDIVTPIMHPIETAKGLGSLAASGIDVLQEAIEPYSPIPTGGRIQYGEPEPAEQFKQFIVDRYGSVDAFKQTVQEDPVGALADASMVLMGGGALAGKTAKLGAALEPAGLAAKTAKKAVGKMVPKKLPEKLYESAAKFGTTVPRAQRSQMIETALKEGIAPTAKGLTKLQETVSGLNKGIDDLIKAAETSGKSVPASAVFSGFKKIRQEMGGPRIEGARDLRIINKVAKDYKQHLDKLGKTHLSPTELQEFKKDIWRRVNFEKSQQRASIPKEEAYYTAGSGARGLIEEMVPEVGPMNLREGRLLELRRPLEKAASRIENRDLLGLSAPLKIGGGAAVGDVPGTALGTAAAIADLPKAKALAAQQLYNIQQRANLLNMLEGSVPGALTRQGLLQAGRYENR